MNRRKVGVHCSVRRGFTGALEEAVALGCDTFQMFTQSPRGWQTRVYTEEEFFLFKHKCRQSPIDSVVVHSPYLPNLCTSNSLLYEKSIQSLRDDLRRSQQLDAKYLVIHPGAFSDGQDAKVGLDQLTAAINLVFSEIDGATTLLIENMAGGGRRLGGRFEELAEMLKRVEQNHRIGICFDTCHAMAAGYDLSQRDTIEKVCQEFDDTVGLDRIKVFHVNDIKGTLGCQRDRHENLGSGAIGLKGFKTFFNRPEFADCLYILETPKEPQPTADIENMKKLRACL